ncbi:toluene tolerance protein [Pseudomonas sp. BW13M1]|uniref:Toluene tolerance protein n=1 Tax=Pseudomonas peradeniyensis TaxID=2745488 RepID=A0A923K0N5_9PSED|nr:toluene tolerance protein [Pseudomonas peradeniyensis]MBV4505345.1 toluene tolerance protein [Pseudomonas peradeniyensis]
MQCSRLSQVDFDRLTLGAKVLEADSHGAKVYLLGDGNILKVFRRKRLISSALLRPYSQRFIDNAVRLTLAGFPTLEVISHHKLPLPGRTAVLYRPLPGETLLQLSRKAGFSWDRQLPRLVELIRRLHRTGIYFRSLHLGNVVETPEGLLGLIDVADMRFLRAPLSPRMVQRNVQHMVRYIEREPLARDFPLDQFQAALAAR